MMRLSVSAVALLATVAFAFAATDAEIKTKIVGSWGPTETCEDGPLVFKADGSFALQPPPGSSDPELAGTYMIMDGQLSGKTAMFTMDTLPISFDGDKLVMGPASDPDVLVRCKTK